MLHAEIDEEFNRNVWCLLGLPFDTVKMEDVVESLHFLVSKNKPLFLSTPNLNFLIASQDDADFRNSVINSDLSVVDGKPLVWVARLLKIPVPERIAGSDLIEILIRNKNEYKPLSVFFFGGEGNVAEISCGKLNDNLSGLSCAGSLNPGFGSIEDMSSDEIINQVNRSGADFIIVSLGAKKGQAWIEKNRENLNNCVISHLGAVVNFIAGNVKRSPVQLQKLGLEWLWRIKEEPALWRRYLIDGVRFVYLLIFKVFPYSVLIRLHENRNKKPALEISLTENQYESIVNVKGYFDSKNIHLITQVFRDIAMIGNDTTVNISNSSYINGEFIGKLLILKKCLHDTGNQLKVKTDSHLIQKIFYYNNCEYLIDS